MLQPWKSKEGKLAPEFKFSGFVLERPKTFVYADCDKYLKNFFYGCEGSKCVLH